VSNLKPPVWPHGTRPLAWAGLLLNVPTGWQLHRIEGNARKGGFTLGEADHLRLEASWLRIKEPKGDIDAFCRKQLLRTLSKEARKQDPTVQPVSNPRWSSIVSVAETIKEQTTLRVLGFSKATSRIVQLAIHQHEQIATRHILSSIVDQPSNEQSWWSFFDVSFAAMPDLNYRVAKLNIGDMRVEMTKSPSEYEGPLQVVRHIYPAGLALKRQPFEKWMQKLLHDDRKMRIPAVGRQAAKNGEFDACSCPLGDGITTDVRLRRGFRLMYWREPKIKRNWIIHDERFDRLIIIQLADREEKLQALFEHVVDSMHWAQIGSRGLRSRADSNG